ncbi:hypothetical protein VD0001_g9236, partial [Verticillium dahliae]
GLLANLEALRRSAQWCLPAQHHDRIPRSHGRAAELLIRTMGQASEAQTS